MTSSVPQGSVLGPILFLIYINDLGSCVNSPLSLYADDTKLFRIIKSEDDHRIVQEDINEMLSWSSAWEMKFNEKKCHVLHIGKNNPKHQYMMEGNVLQSVESEKDVGVLVQHDLKVNEQCAVAVKKANCVLGQIKRSFNSRSPDVIIKAYKQYVLPHLEYCVQAWSPYLQKDIMLLEKVQKRALRLIPSLNGLSYEEKLQQMGMLSLQARREILDLVQLFKMKSGLDCLSFEDYFEYCEHKTVTRSITNKNLKMPKSRLQSRKEFFTCRVISCWNKLPESVRESTSLPLFKSRLNSLYTLASV